MLWSEFIPLSLVVWSVVGERGLDDLNTRATLGGDGSVQAQFLESVVNLEFETLLEEDELVERKLGSQHVWSEFTEFAFFVREESLHHL